MASNSLRSKQSRMSHNEILPSSPWAVLLRKVSKDLPGTVFCKQYWSTEERALNILKSERNVPEVGRLPPVINPIGLSRERAEYLLGNSGILLSGYRGSCCARSCLDDLSLANKFYSSANSLFTFELRTFVVYVIISVLCIVNRNSFKWGVNIFIKKV